MHCGVQKEGKKERVTKGDKQRMGHTKKAETVKERQIAA